MSKHPIYIFVQSGFVSRALSCVDKWLAGFHRAQDDLRPKKETIKQLAMTNVDVREVEVDDHQLSLGVHLPQIRIVLFATNGSSL